MSLAIAGSGWVTPLGSGIDEVWGRLLTGTESAHETVADSPDTKAYPVFRVPSSALVTLPPHPRLRRSSAISRFAAAAGLDAIENARSTSFEIEPSKTALILAVSNGGVVYTKRFYHDIVETGANAASPLLFPETVFNAPASHLAAILGITGATYTVVGDAAVGVLAMKMAEDLLADAAMSACLVVGAEEVDWLLCDAYRRWRLTRGAPPIEPFHASVRGTVLSEGAGAVLLTREGAIKIDNIHAGRNFRQRKEVCELLQQVLIELGAEDAGGFVLSANGTFVDCAEQKALENIGTRSPVYTFKPALGESAGSTAIWQVIAAAQMLRTKRVPPVLHASATTALTLSGRAAEFHRNTVIVSAVGLNQQLAGLRLSI